MKYDDFDASLNLAANSTRSWTFGVNWFLKADDIKLQFNYLISDVDGPSSQNKRLILRLQTIF